MSLQDFLATLAANQPPAGLSLAQTALWHARRGEWEAAHECAQEQADRAGSWVHAYLHRQEGDEGNAGYWYRQAGQPFCRASLEAEWEQLVEALFPE